MSIQLEAARSGPVYARPLPFVRRASDRRIEVFSPKLGRRLSLMSYAAWQLWLALEANPAASTFCERPTFIAGSPRRIIDFWVRFSRPASDEFWLLDDAQIRLDNARAHLATTSLDVLCDTLGCTADFGPAYEPDDRPFIERFFGTLTATLSRRLPGALLPRKRQAQEQAIARRRPKESSLQMIVTSQELQELLEHTIWNYHGTPHAGLGGLTPLEMMRRHILGIGRPAVRLRILPSQLREQPQLLHDPVSCQVRGQLARGERPYITYMHVRYTSPQLSRRPGLVGQTLRVHADPQDLRQLVVTTTSGEILEPLLASGPWREHAHSLWLRRAFFKAKRMRQLDFAAGDDPIEAFLAHRRRQARRSKRAASDIARVQHERARAKSSAKADPAAPEKASEPVNI